MNIEKNIDAFSPTQICQHAETSAIYKLNKPILNTATSSIMAGFFIAVGFAFYITATTGTSMVPYGIAKLIGGICFSLGLMLVVCCGPDLFTSTILTILTKMSGKTSWKKIFKNWFLVYIHNFIGAILFTLIIWFSGQYMAADGLWGLNILNTAEHKLHHTFIEALCLGILCNLMVCLAVWMSYSGRSLLDKMFIMILPVAMFVSSGFEHSIANMFMIPMGIIIKDFAPYEFWQAIGEAKDSYHALTVHNFIIKNLIPVTIGNIIGGLAVALPNWVLYLRQPKRI